MTAQPTRNQKEALKWLINRTGDGVFDKNQVLTASGDCAPVRRSTWNKLEALGLVELYLNRRRIKVTEAGLQINLSKVKEAQ